MITRILHLSDPHFGTEKPGVVQALYDAIVRLAPDLVVLSGDITQRARRAEFRAARAFVERLAPCPVLAVPGNHDIPLFNPLARTLWPYRNYRRFHPELYPRVRLPQVEVVGFVSAPWWRHIDGELDVQQADARLAQLDDGAALRIAVLHHPLACRQAVDQTNLIHHSQRLLACLARRRVGLVLGGHVHDPYVVAARSRYALPAESAAPVLALAGTCVSRRTRYGAPNSFNLVEFQAGQPQRLSISRMDLVAEEGPFQSVEVSRFVLQAGGWQPLPPPQG